MKGSVSGYGTVHGDLSSGTAAHKKAFTTSKFSIIFSFFCSLSNTPTFLMFCRKYYAREIPFFVY